MASIYDARRKRKKIINKLLKENMDSLSGKNAKKDASLFSKKWRTYLRYRKLAACIKNMNILCFHIKYRNLHLHFLLLPITIDGFKYVSLKFDFVFYLHVQARFYIHLTFM